MNEHNHPIFPKFLNLSGADCFFLAMEKHYMKYGTTGNTCHLLVSLDGSISKPILLEKINSMPFFNWLANIKLKRAGYIGLPRWEYDSSTKNVIEIKELHNTEEKIPLEITRQGIFLNDSVLFRFTIIHRANGKSDVVFSWHHIIMDAQGAETILRLLGGDVSPEKVTLFPLEPKKVNIFKALSILHFSKEFVKKTTKKPLVALITKKPDYIPVSCFHVLELNETETARLDAKALLNGARISKGSFYLASTTKAINDWLVTKGNTKGAYWIPVPQNRRPRGNYGPVVSNLQSFLFYRIPREKLSHVKECTEYLTSQMFDLIRHKRPENYAIMSDVLRYFPSSFYYFLIKGSAGGSMASFLYSDPGVNEFNSFMGMPVRDITNYPPGTFPPGLMTIFERFNGKQKIIINYTHPIVSTEDLRILEGNLRKELLG